MAHLIATGVLAIKELTDQNVTLDDIFIGPIRLYEKKSGLIHEFIELRTSLAGSVYISYVLKF